jgi:uncharacterized protein (DUF488 family)
MDDQAPVFTVGHGARSTEELLAVLRSAGVGELVDIRRHPGSRRHPRFGREALAAALGRAGIGYRWEGEALGGRRSVRADSRHTALARHTLAGYADHMDTVEFRSAVDAIVARAATARPAVMCAEGDWRHCHRMLVADALAARGARVTHLVAPGRSEPHRPHPTLRWGSDGWPVYDVADTIPGT